MATLLGANVYIDQSATKHNTNPVGSVSGDTVTITGYDVSDVVAPGASFTAEFTKVYDNGTETAKTPAETYTLAASGDTTAPTISSATIEDAAPSDLVVVFSEVVNITDLTGISITGTGAPAINSVSGTGTNTLTFVLSAAAQNGDSWTLDVAGTNNIIDGASNALAATSQAITNNVVIQLQGLTVDANTYSFDTTNYNAIFTTPVNHLLTPNIFYKNGKTLLGFLQNDNNRIGLIEYSNQHGLRAPHVIKGTLGGFNYHNIPVIDWEGNRLSLTQEDNHNINLSKFHTAQADNDSLIFTANAGSMSNVAMTYHNVYNYNGNKVIICQYEDIEGGYAINPAGTLGGTWTNVRKLVARNTDEVERYQLGIDNKSLSTDIIFVSVGRNGALAIPTWFRFNVFRARVNPTSGYLDFYTMNGALIYAGSSGKPEMNTTEMQSGQFYEIADNTQQGFIPVTALDQSDNFYAVHANGSGTYILTIWKSTDAAPVNQTISFPDAPTLITTGTQDGACTHMIVLSSNEIYTFWRVNNGTRTIIRQYKSVDEGVNWTFEKDIDFGFDVYSMKTPTNYLDIGNNNNFMLVAGSSPGTSPSTTTPVQIGIKKASFGNLQALTNIYDTLTPISEAAYNSTAVASYFIESGKITNTGTTLNTVIDQSSNANDITVLGSPVLDDGTTPTEMTFDGVDDAIPLNPAILTSGKSYLMIGVVDTLAKDNGLLTISNNANANSFIIPQISGLSDSRLRTVAKYNDINTEIIKGDTPLTAGYHIAAFLFRGDFHDVPMYLDGKMQFRIENTTVGTQNEGRYILPNGNTHLEVGRLVRDTTAYYNYKMKHVAIHDVTSESQIIDRIKFLGNKYGITLNNLYR